MRKITRKILTKLPTRYAATGVALIALLFAYGIIGSYIILGLGPIDSIYYAVITMTTVGYGDTICNNIGIMRSNLTRIRI